MSVLTNEGSMAALRNLNKTNAEMAVNQNRINTGLKVAGAKDDAATFQIAQNLRADIAGLNSVQNSLDRASSSIDVALAAGEAVSDLLIEMRELAVAAGDTGLDSVSRGALQQEFEQVQEQVDSIVTEASFNGTNAVNGSTDIVAITNDTGTSTISIAAVDISTSGLSLDTGSVGISTTTNAQSAVTAIDNAISSVNSALSDLGAGAIRLDLQQEFTTALSDAIDTGIGNLVDADLAQESANLQSLQVRQQLGSQALSIANQAPNSVLGLFG